MGETPRNEQQLIYIWVGSHKNIKNTGFNFSPNFKVNYDLNLKEISVERKEVQPDNFFASKDNTEIGENISNITAIIGKNGSGKSSILELIPLFLTPKHLMSKSFKGFYIIYSIKNGLGIVNFKCEITETSLIANDIGDYQNYQGFTKDSTHHFIKYSNFTDTYTDSIPNHMTFDISSNMKISLDKPNLYRPQESQFREYLFNNIKNQAMFLNEKFSYTGTNKTFNEYFKKLKSINSLVLNFHNYNYIEKLKDDLLGKGAVKGLELNPKSIKKFGRISIKYLNEAITKYNKILKNDENREEKILPLIFEKEDFDDILKNINLEIYPEEVLKDSEIFEKLVDYYIESFKKMFLYEKIKNREVKLPKLSTLILDRCISDLTLDIFDKSSFLRADVLELFHVNSNFESNIDNFIELIDNYERLYSPKNTKDSEIKFYQPLRINKRLNILKEFVLNSKFEKDYLVLNDFRFKIINDLNFEVPLTIQMRQENDIRDLFNENAFDLLEKLIYPITELTAFGWSKELSSGEKAFLNMCGRFYSLLNKIDLNGKADNLIFLLDEPEVGFHPEWSRNIVSFLIGVLSQMFPSKNIQIFLTSHSPFVAGDLPKENVIFLINNGGNCKIEDHRIETFGANIYSLFRSGFFLESTFGEFARNKIQWAIKMIEENKFKDLDIKIQNEINYVIDSIGDSLIKNKIQSMINDQKSNEEKIIELEEQLKKLKGDSL